MALLPDFENHPAWVRRELEALAATLGDPPTPEELRALTGRLSPAVREYFRQLAVRAEVAVVALEMQASEELADAGRGAADVDPIVYAAAVEEVRRMLAGGKSADARDVREGGDEGEGDASVPAVPTEPTSIG